VIKRIKLVAAGLIAASVMQSREQEMVPEEVGKRAACALLSQIHAGGTVDQLHQVRSSSFAAEKLFAKQRSGIIASYLPWYLFSYGMGLDLCRRDGRPFHS